MRFTVFGLGDTSYEQYNAIGKYINEVMEEFGGERIYKYGEGNAEGNLTEDDFNDWKANLWEEIFQWYKLKAPVADPLLEVSQAVEIAMEEV